MFVKYKTPGEDPRMNELQNKTRTQKERVVSGITLQGNNRNIYEQEPVKIEWN